MRANTDRTKALQFGAIAETYDAGRLGFESPLFHTVLGSTLLPGSTVLEFGAGTGLLTEALEAEDLDIVAAEPDVRLLDVLASRAGDKTHTMVATLDELVSDHQHKFDVVIGANTLHWIDPSVASRQIKLLVKPGGQFIALWNFPLVAGLYAVAAEVEALGYSTHLFQRNKAEIEESFADGMTEFASDGHFQIVKEIEYDDRVEFQSDEVADLVGSYRLGDDERDGRSQHLQLRKLLRDVSDRYPVNNLVLGWIATPTDGP